ncbi:MAG: indolepyruvate ferredoxin oxidoreductase subunit alpha [Dehalococcoidales bacterium]|nr:indolepyruvate ferredoxin oxidoreductase subunit alpha [Dehalococcoidales bacterium]
MENTLQLLSGNEALALGAYHAGVQVACAYPGTPSTEILENLARFKDIYAEWSTNEKVAMEVGMGASYTGARTMVSMKMVGLNVAADPFMAASITGVIGGLVVISADDPQIHSSQNEQDNRHYARLAKVPMLEPSDSQDVYDLMNYAFDISEEFDTPVLFRTTTRIAHSKSVVNADKIRVVKNLQPAFLYNPQKYIMLPVNALPRHTKVEERMIKLARYCETFPMNQVIWNKKKIGIVTSGVAYQYAREAFPEASFLKLAMTWPLPQKMIKSFAAKVENLIVIEELDPFLQDNIKAMGIKVSGKEIFPIVGELNTRIVTESSIGAGLIPESEKSVVLPPAEGLPKRPPLLCPGCPHTGIYYTLNTVGQRTKLAESSTPQEPKLIITGDIGCYTLGAYPPHNVLDTTACMGAGIGQALGMEKAGVKSKVVAVIGDSTFMHSGITGLVNAVYNQGHITILILDNHTTAMTGHQEHPGTGVSAQGKETYTVDIESLCKGIGVKDLKVINAFDLKALRTGLRDSIDKDELSVIIVRGACAVQVKKRQNPRKIDVEKCTQCGICLKLGCPAIQSANGQVFIEPTLCAGDICGLCEQLCPQKAISA